MGRWLAIFKILQQGVALFDGEKWKTRAIISYIVAALSALVAALPAFGIELLMSDAEVQSFVQNLAEVVFGVSLLVGGWMHIGSDEKLGLPNKNKNGTTEQKSRESFLDQ